MSELLPVNVAEAIVVSRANALAGGTGVVVTAPTPPNVDQLASWSQENYQLDVKAAASLGFPVGHLSGELQHDMYIFGTSRWADVDSGDGHVYRFGVSLRVLVKVERDKFIGDVALPFIAANVELERATASAQLVIRGYNSATLGKLLPAWQSFSVDSYSSYMTAISAIQEEIMANDANVLPQLLATTVASVTLPSSAQSVGTVTALRAIADGKTLQEALDRVTQGGADASTIRDSIERQYQSMGIASDAEPTAADRSAAQNQVGDFDAKHHWWSRGSTTSAVS
jgi:hypothetical protein